MRRLILAAALFVGLAAPAWANGDKGFVPYERGAWETTFQELQLLAERGDVLAQVRLGLLYYIGRGVSQDYATAYMWLDLAAAQGKEIARKHRELIAKKMTPADILKAQRLAREWKPKKE